MSVRTRLSLALAALAAIALAGCGGGHGRAYLWGSSLTSRPIIRVTNVVGTLDMHVGDKFQLRVEREIEYWDDFLDLYRYITDDVTYHSEYWSSAPSVALVDSNGVVTAVGVGTAVIHIKHQASGYKAAVVDAFVRVT
jgi:hypothetical protein